MIPKEKIEEVRTRASIVQVISEYLPLKKRGANYVGLCPFHSENTPSFSVSEEKKIFYCFGCNATGNAITFIMKKEGSSFPEAVRTLARRYGVTIEEEDGKAADEKAALYHVNRLSLEYFVRELRGNDGREARDYLKKRGYDPAALSDEDILGRFSVGFAPESWEGLTGWLRRKGVPMDSAEKAGVVVRKERGHYDRFRKRVIFPITDVKGRITGFGGRSVDGSNPKYLNTPETAIFKKGETLFGLSQARAAISKEGFVMVVEGYFDLLALHRHGFQNSVATMGTALTPAHLRTLKSYTSSVYSLFDADEAGKNASLRGLDLFLNEEVSARIVRLPSAKDPDEFLSAEGPGAMKKAIDGAEPLIEFSLRELGKRFTLDKPEGKGRYLDVSLGYLTRIKNVAERDHYAAFVASLLDIPVSSVYEAVTGRTKGNPGKTYNPGGAAPVRPGRPEGSNLKELTILKVIIRHPELFDENVSAAIEAFSDGRLKEAGRAMTSSLKKKKPVEVSELFGEFKDEDTLAWLASELMKDDDGFVEDPRKMLDDCLKKVMNRGKLKETTEEMIKRLEESGLEEAARKMRARAEKGRLNKRRSIG